MVHDLRGEVRPDDAEPLDELHVPGPEVGIDAPDGGDELDDPEESAQSEPAEENSPLPNVHGTILSNVCNSTERRKLVAMGALWYRGERNNRPPGSTLRRRHG